MESAAAIYAAAFLPGHSGVEQKPPGPLYIPCRLFSPILGPLRFLLRCNRQFLVSFKIVVRDKVAVKILAVVGNPANMVAGILLPDGKASRVVQLDRYRFKKAAPRQCSLGQQASKDKAQLH